MKRLTFSFDADNIIFKDKFEPVNSSFRTRTYVGLHSPMYCSAAGKCYLAFSSESVRETYWKRNVSTMKPLTENTILDKSQFFGVLDKIKSRGYALDDEENEAVFFALLSLFLTRTILLYTRLAPFAYAKNESSRLRRDLLAEIHDDITTRIEQQLF